MRGCLWVVVFVGILASGACRRPAPAGTPSSDRLGPVDLLAAPTGNVIDESWAVHLVRGAKIGHRHTRVYRLADRTPPLLWIVTADRLEMRRFGETVSQELITASLETEAGNVRQLAYELRSNDERSRVDGVVAGEELLLTRTANGGGDQVRRKWDGSQGGVFAVERSLRRTPMQPGERRDVSAFWPLIDRTASIELVALQNETVDVDGKPRTLLRLEATDPRAAGWQIPTMHWVDAEGQIVKTQEPFLDRQTVAANQVQATRPNDSLPVDLGIGAGVRIEPPISNPHSVRYAVYRIEMAGMSPERVLATGLSQRVLPAEPGVALVTVTQVTPTSPAVVDMDIPPPRPEDLAANALVQCEHPRVRAIANSVAGTVDDPWLAAQLLERHVHGRLDKTDYSRLFSSAAETAERRQGDCSEHAVLLAALCRSRGIPARVAIGLLYSDQHQSFLYHMWNEVWIADRWVPLDATRGPEGMGGLHIKLRDSNLDRETPFELVSPVVYLIEKLKIQVVATRDTSPSP